MHDHLRSSPVYQGALRTGSIMGETPANSTLALRSRRYEHMRDDLRIYSAGKKLDHLIRRALDPMIRYIGPYEVSAIMVFLNEFDRTFLKMRITDQARQWIEPRIAFCREMIDVAKQEYEAYGWPSPSPDGFHDLIIREGETVHEIVYHNPFYTIACMGTPTRLYREIQACYWN
jgi:hypothetical protein